MSEILYYVTFDIIELHWTNIQNVIILCYNIVIIFYICPHNKYALQNKVHWIYKIENFIYSGINNLKNL